MDKYKNILIEQCPCRDSTYGTFDGLVQFYCPAFNLFVDEVHGHGDANNTQPTQATN